SEALEASGDCLGACDAALLGLERFPSDRDLQYRAILNLSRAGAKKRARQLWEKYGLKENLKTGECQDGLELNIAALGARLDREDAFDATPEHRAAKLSEAAARYESIYLQTDS